MVASKRAMNRPSKPAAPERQPGDLEAAPDRDRRVAGEEEVGGDAVRHEQRRHAGISPDHALGRRQRRESLHGLPEREDDEQSEERADGGPEHGPRQQEDPRRVDDQGAQDQEAIRANGDLSKPTVHPGGELMESVADAILGKAPAHR